MDQVWENYGRYDLGRPMHVRGRPSDVVREHIWGCFIDDPVGLANLDTIGVDRILWESDYPHADSLWPHSRTNAKKVFGEIPTDIVRKIVHDNACQLLNLGPGGASST